MSEQGAAAAKLCRVCGEDCSTRQRVRDKQGRYVCKDCLDRAKAQHGGAAAGGSGEVGGETPSGSDDWLFGDIPRTEPCPSCQAPVRDDQQICLRCGYNKRSGKKVRSRVIEEKKKRSQSRSVRRTPG